MDETNATITEPGIEQPAEQASGTAPTDSGEKLLPQSQVNALIAQARREGAASATKKAAPSPQHAAQPVAPAASGQDVIAQMAARLEEMELRGRFDRVAIKAGLDDSQSDNLFDLFKVQRPQDPAAWLGEKAEVFGLGRKPAVTPNPATPNQQQIASPTTQPNPAPIAPPRVTPDLGAPAPGGQRDVEAILLNRPLDANSHDFERLVAQHGQAKALDMWMANINAHLSGVKVVPPHRRPR